MRNKIMATWSNTIHVWGVQFQSTSQCTGMFRGPAPRFEHHSLAVWRISSLAKNLCWFNQTGTLLLPVLC